MTQRLIFQPLLFLTSIKGFHMFKLKICICFCLVSLPSFADSFSQKLSQAAIERTKISVRYDGSYIKIDYPNGDVPSGIGVCTDVVIRSYRKIGIDLQRLVHEDLKSNFSAYPSNRIWGMTRADTNIDHRRVPNLQTFFTRKGQSLKKSRSLSDYLPGDLVTWMLPGNLPHIGIVTSQVSPSSGRPLISHNIGMGPELGDMLFEYTITGHYRFVPATDSKEP